MLDQGDIPPDFAYDVPSSMLWRLTIADLLAKLWYVWVIIVFGACFAAAHFLTHQQGQDGVA